MNKHVFSLIVLVLSLLFFRHEPVTAQQSTVYASVLSSKLFVVGAANPGTGLYYQQPSEDTVWQHAGATRIRAFGLAIDPASKGKTLYIASGNGVHKSTDGGATWRITTGWEITEVLCVTPDPGNEDVVYIATAYGVYKTTDGCATWKQMNEGLAFPPFVQSLIIDHSDRNTLYCAAEKGVYVSHNAAASWERTGLNVINARVVVQHPRDPRTLFVGTENNGIYRTTNGGKWWSKIEAGIDNDTFYAIAYDPSHPDTMYAGGYVTGVYKSADGGTTWARMSQGLGCLSIHSLAVDPNNGSRVYAGTIWSGMYRSETSGTQWTYAGLPEAEVWTIVIQSH